MTADYEAVRAHEHAISQVIPMLEAISSVAEIAFRRAESRLPPLARYAQRVDDQLASLESLTGTMASAVEDETARELLVVVSSERGLCGAFNQRLIERVRAELNRRRGAGGDVIVACLGRRGQVLLESAGERMAYSTRLSSFTLPAYLEIERVAVDVLDLMEHEACTRLLVMYNAPLRRFHYQVRTRQLLPVPPASSPERMPAADVRPAGDEEDLLTHLVTERVLIDLYQAVVESAVSEELARVAAMRLATDNARHLLEDLSQQANLARQIAETSALLEIISGAQAASNLVR